MIFFKYVLKSIYLFTKVVSPPLDPCSLNSFYKEFVL